VPGLPRPATGPLAGRKGTILLVEDEETVRRFVARSLSALGYTLLEARDGAAALELGRKQASLDLLLTDVVMPNLNGGRLAESLRAAHPDLKVVFMSGYPDKVALPLGFPDRQARFLQKPFGQAQVARLVQEFLEQPK
jgi:CheY-like chemotaxis protein